MSVNPGGNRGGVLKRSSGKEQPVKEGGWGDGKFGNTSGQPNRKGRKGEIEVTFLAIRGKKKSLTMGSKGGGAERATDESGGMNVGYTREEDREKKTNYFPE